MNYQLPGMQEIDYLHRNLSEDIRFLPWTPPPMYQRTEPPWGLPSVPVMLQPPVSISPPEKKFLVPLDEQQFEVLRTITNAIDQAKRDRQYLHEQQRHAQRLQESGGQSVRETCNCPCHTNFRVCNYLFHYNFRAR